MRISCRRLHENRHEQRVAASYTVQRNDASGYFAIGRMDEWTAEQQKQSLRSVCTGSQVTSGVQYCAHPSINHSLYYFHVHTHTTVGYLLPHQKNRRRRSHCKSLELIDASTYRPIGRYRCSKHTSIISLELAADTSLRQLILYANPNTIPSNFTIPNSKP